MQKILISGCLVGELVRYDAGHCLIEGDVIQAWQDEGRLVVICPEMAGGLPAPRAPCEIREGQVLDKDGNEYTQAFDKGADIALELIRKHNIRYALLKEQSPSCGSTRIYDGSFTSQKMPGAGVTAKKLKENGVTIFSEETMDQLQKLLSS